MKIGIITVSDKGSKNERKDLSGPAIKDFFIKKMLINDFEYQIVADEKEQIKKALLDFVNKNCNLIFTTGGTGFGDRDVTPEATKEVIEKDVPGIPEAVRFESYKITKKAMLSRACAGIKNKTLIINLPGSPKACVESLEIILPVLLHALEVLFQGSAECGSDKYIKED